MTATIAPGNPDSSRRLLSLEAFSLGPSLEAPWALTLPETWFNTVLASESDPAGLHWLTAAGLAAGGLTGTSATMLFANSSVPGCSSISVPGAIDATTADVEVRINTTHRIARLKDNWTPLLSGSPQAERAPRKAMKTHLFPGQP
jgi:hypothetical protein